MRESYAETSWTVWARTRRVAPLVALALAVAASPVRTQTNAERIATEADTRSHDFDLVHQRIVLSRFDWDSLSFSGRVTTTVIALKPHFDTLRLDCGPLLAVRDVRGQRNERLGHTSRGDTLAIALSRAVGYGDTVRVTLEYDGRVDNGRGLTFIRADGRAHRPQQLWSMGEPEDNHRWFPTYDFPNDKETWELTATVPAAMRVISNGRLASDRPASGGHTVTWRQDQPASTYLVSLVIGPFVRLRDRWRAIPVDAYVYAEDTARARELFRMTPSVIKTYERLLGVPYPWPKYAQTTVADFFGGEEMVSATTLVDWLPDARAYRDRPWFHHVLIPHELAHQWFGDDVTTANWANVWLNEGFADFMNGAYWEDVRGRAAGDDFYFDEYQQYIATDKRRRTPLAALGSNNIYPKGALVLRMLRRYLGDERFWASMRRYLADHRFGVAITDDVRRAVLEATGENLDWFFDEWAYGAGHPAFVVTASWDSAAATVTLAVKQTQQDSGGLDSASYLVHTPEVFHMPVVVRVGTATREIVHGARIDAREDTIVVPGVTTAPTMVVFDEGNTILKTLDFEQPTEWLAHQLSRDPDLWNRAWVIGQLSSHRKDSVAVQALAAAATSADAALTRAQAAVALAAVAGHDAQVVLLRAAVDTSAAVRVAALSALASVGDRTAANFAHGTFRVDSSYQVRAMALVAYAHLDTTGRRALFAEGITTPSYRDVIQNAALDQVARLGDTTFIGSIDSLIAEQPRFALTLATLAARGHPIALDALRARLNDPRPWVREWTVSAIEERVPRELATKVLRDAIPTLNHDDTRRRVERVVSQLGNGTTR